MTHATWRPAYNLPVDHRTPSVSRLCQIPDRGTDSPPTALFGRRFSPFPLEAGMSKSEELRKFADNCVELAEAADNGPRKKRLERLAEGWKNLAQTQAWLDGEEDPHPPKAA